MTACVSVVPLARLGKAGSAYTYAVPEHLRAELRTGQLVQVPFRNRAVSGIVVDLLDSEDRPGIRDLVSITDPEPILLPHLMRLATWIATEYAAPLADVMKAMLPPALRGPRSPSSRARGAHVSVAITSEGEHAAADVSRLRRAPSQRRVLETLVRAGKPVLETELLQSAQSAPEPLKALERAGFVTRRIEVPAEGLRPAIPPPASLSAAQAAAASSILKSIETTGPSEVFLLHGVTGSGKTEVYMTVIAEVLKGGAAVVMVPEISLTPQAMNRFSQRFPGQVAPLHSKLSEGERRREWQRIRSGVAKIALGPRSALFAPVPNLRIIIVDEEHDPSYKQAETPRYHARDVAIHLGRSLGIPVILGSATPDVCSYFSARKGIFTLLNLPDRPVWERAKPPGLGTTGQVRSGPDRFRSMPSVEIVDLRQELKAGHRSIFSRALLEAMKETTASKHQALLFLNRRGSATSVVCRDCGFVAKCGECDLPLTYHSQGSRLVCHRCNRRFGIPRTCARCRGSHIRYLGVGTQRVADEARVAMPQARILRWDRDVTTRKGSHENIAAQFERHEADILVGTQMIAKGLDFPLVTLVGVIVADVGMHLPDFRAAERTFQLMTQVAGRAGRADLPSRVIIQSYNPEHYALQAAKSHDYWDFYKQEMTFRHAWGYPPYSRLARFLLRGKDNSSVQQRAADLARAFESAAGERGLGTIELMGPAPAFVARIDGSFQWHLLMRGQEIHELLDIVPPDVVVDIDPVDLL